MYILITAAATAGAYHLKNKLGGSNILLGDYAEVPELLIKSNALIRLPNPGEEAYVHLMLTLCLDRGVEMLYALRPAEKELLLKARQLFAEFNIAIMEAGDGIQ